MISAEAMHAIIAHRRRGDPLTLEAGIVRVADALDMAKGRSRVPFEAGRPNIHSLSAAAIDEVRIEPCEEKAVRIEIDMNNSSGIFQIDELLATKLRGSGLEDHDGGHRAHRGRAREAARAPLPALRNGPTTRRGPVGECRGHAQTTRRELVWVDPRSALVGSCKEGVKPAEERTGRLSRRSLRYPGISGRSSVG